MSLSPDQWSQIQDQLRDQLSTQDFESWISPLRPTAGQDQDEVALAAATPFIKDWVADHYSDLIESSVAEALDKPVKVSYVVKPQVVTPPAAVTPAPQQPVVPVQEGLRLDPRYTFESFVVGKTNSFAHAAAQRIAESEQPVYNPFFLHGQVGLGKTHLMHAIGHTVQAAFPQKKVVYLSAEQFLNQMVTALRERNMATFRETFRSADVLMVDDIQFIASKQNTQEEFFHTYNTVIERGGQVILTADRSPHELDNIEDRLKSRLGSGLTCEIHAPDEVTRQAILLQKAEELEIDLPEPLVAFLAESIASNVRELEGALNRLAAHAQLTGAALTLTFAQEVLRDLFRAHARVLTLDDIQQQVASYYNIKVHDLLGARRLRQIARPRQAAMFLAKKLTPKSYPEIGRAFGGRDHTTVMHAVRTIENLLERDPQLVEDVRVLEQHLTAR